MTFSSFRERAEAWNIDIDTFTNPYTPPSPLHRLPPWLSRFLGYRREHKPDVGNVLGAIWSCVGAFCGLATIAAVFNNTASIRNHHPPALIASFGASAILEYNAVRSPLGQPRNAVFGHTLSAIIGISITKLFLYHSEFERIRWIAGAIACGTASAVMLLTGTVHPPGGASAVLAATSPEIIAMGWFFAPLVMLGTTLMLIIGLVVNNIQRQFPVYWWTPIDLRALHASKKRGDEEARSEKIAEILRDGDERTHGTISVSASEISVPEDLVLSKEEVRLLEGLRERLEIRGKEVEACNLDRVPSSRSSTDRTYAASRGEGRESETRVLDSSS